MEHKIHLLACKVLAQKNKQARLFLLSCLQIRSRSAFHLVHEACQ